MPLSILDSELPFTGRVADLERLTSAVLTVRPASAVIAGPAGVGKSRLAAEVAEVVRSQGRSAVRIIATRATAAVPFGAFASMLPSGARAADLGALLEQARETIAARSNGAGPLLLVVDDAHLLDDGSAALVHQLVQTGSCGVLAAVRTGAPTPDAVVSLWKDTLAARFDLPPLDRVEVEQLVARALDGQVAGPLLEWLWRTSRGNPLYLRELLLACVRSAQLRREGEVWVFEGPPPASQRLRELVASRVAEAGEQASEVVDLLAVGEPLAVSLLEGLVGAGPVEDAEASGLIEVDVESGVAAARLNHPVIGDVRRRAMPRTRLRRYCRTLADALAVAATGDADDELRIATLRLDADDHSDPDLFERAARYARDRFDLTLAARLAHAALDAGAGVRAGLALAEAEFFSGRHDSAEQILRSLAPRCRDDGETAMIANARAYNLGFLVGDYDAGVAILAEALSTVTEPGPRLRLGTSKATHRMWRGEATAAIADAADALLADDTQMRFRAAYVSSISVAVTGQADRAVDLVDDYMRYVTAAGPGPALRPAALLIGSAVAHLAVGRLAAARQDADTGYAIGLESGDDECTATYSLMRGWVMVEQGFLLDAASSFREGVALDRQLNDRGPLRWCAGGVALAEAMSGNAEAARAAVDELDAVRPHWMALFDLELVERARAWALAATGDTAAACERLRESAARAADTDQWVAEARLLHDMVRLGRAGHAAPRLAQLAEIVDGDLVACFAQHAAARSTTSARVAAAELETVSTRFRACGALLLAAEAADSSAVRFGDIGLERKAAAMSRVRDALLSECGLAWLPWLTPRGSQGRLTRREREVATLAAARMSSKDIAERLHLSPRTVENHLQNAYTKLGVVNRGELASALVTAGERDRGR